ncbi:MAG: 2,3-bisphosphoglycerate-independent phosphoglycerate mutase [Candidatus Thermoplasmatota archaeon]|nr:2,3-bisphosphoglycerate-independent phosphoglycerate mutase [Candidatus Thermoplasmatota archaeon]
MKSILLLVLDGLGDRPNPELNGRTALQAAFRPNMNHLAAVGQTGQMHPVKPGIRSGSDTSHLSLLGYDPEKFYTGRGPFEAMGLGLDVRGGDIAFRANFGTRKENGEITDRRAGRINNGTELLAKDLSMNIDGVDFFVRAGVEHRAALVMRGNNLSDLVTDSDPHEVGVKVREISATGESAKFTAEVLNKYLTETRKILDTHEVNLERKKNGESPANELLLRGAGLAPSLPLFREKTYLKGACITGIPMISGICRLAGMDLIDVKGATGRLDSDFSAKFAAAFKALGTYDFLVMNIKATDVAGHDGDAIAKKNAIERIDRAMGGIEGHLDDSVICITGDHSTPCVMKDHSGDPVPIVFTTSGIRKDSVRFFDEISCARGSYNIMSGDVLRILQQLSDRSEKYGA